MSETSKISSASDPNKLEELVKSGKASEDQIREFFTGRDLAGLATEKTYLKESAFTKEWACPHCGGPIPCSIDCPQCGRPRPIGNADPDQEGVMGYFRRKAKARNK